MDWFNLVGRILFALVFLLSGYGHLANRPMMTQYTATKGVPAAGAAVVLSGIAIIVAGILIVLGRALLWAGWILFWFLIATSFLMHAYWKETDPQVRMNERIHFLKDLSLAGAALLIVWSDYTGVAWPLVP